MVEAADAAPSAPDELAAPSEGTPVQPEQAAEAPGEDRADKPQSAPDQFRTLQAEYTRSQQQWSALRSELGLGRDARPEDVYAAFHARLETAPEVEEIEEQAPPPDPRVQELEMQLFLAEMRTQQAVYGEEFANDSIELINIARTSDDPKELVPAVAAFVARHRELFGPDVQGAMPQAPAGEPEMVDISLSESDAGPTAAKSLEAELARVKGLKADRGPAAVAAIFRGLGIGRPIDT